MVSTSSTFIAERTEAGGVSVVQWALAALSLMFAYLGYLTTQYDRLAQLGALLLITNLALLAVVAKEALSTRLLGKFFLISSCLVFYWIDAFDLSRQQLPFAVPEGLPLSTQQFDQQLLQAGFV